MSKSVNDRDGTDDRHAARREQSARRRHASAYVGQLDRFEDRLVALIEDLRAAKELDARTWDRIGRRHGRGDRIFSKSDVILAFRHLAPRYGWTEGAEEFIARIRMKPVRTMSGVAPVTVLTRPQPCPGSCLFCPDEDGMPKSYLSMEPGAQRAKQYDFDPFRQTWNRLRALQNNGHRTDKVEQIILGGTWTAYPEPYRVWFVKRCFDAMNEFGGREENPTVVGDEQALEKASRGELLKTFRHNETAACRSVGLSVETRPDELRTAEDVLAIRELGATKVQLGYQSLDDEILRLNGRGHDVAAIRRATRLLREGGFKVQAHWMPNLLGADRSSDIADFERLFADPAFRPDELKIYPCCLTEGSPLRREYEAGRWAPYAEEDLLDVLVAALDLTPAYCRITRVIRDIPSHDIVAGNRASNLRERAEAELMRRGGVARDIRARQIRRPLEDREEVRIAALEYEVATGREVFLQGSTDRDELVGFLRLSLPDGSSAIAELGQSAVVREVHVYGTVVGLGMDGPDSPQHRGLGGRLLRRAEAVAAEKGFGRLAVISAVGTREYYRRHGFADGDVYQHKQVELD